MTHDHDCEFEHILVIKPQTGKGLDTYRKVVTALVGRMALFHFAQAVRFFFRCQLLQFLSEETQPLRLLAIAVVVKLLWQTDPYRPHLHNIQTLIAVLGAEVCNVDPLDILDVGAHQPQRLLGPQPLR